MSLFKKTKGSSLVISLGMMSLLLILSATLVKSIFYSAHFANNIANANKAYFAAESGLEEALYELSNHLSGFETENSGNLTNKAKYDFTIEYRDNNGRIPRLGKGNSPSDTDWNRIAYKETYNLNLFYDTSTKGNKTIFECENITCNNVDITNPNGNLTSLKIYLRTPNGETLEADDVFLSWVLTGVDKVDAEKKYTLLPRKGITEIDGAKINGVSSLGHLVLDSASGINTGKNLDKNTFIEINNFINNANIHMPQLKLSLVSELNDNIGNPIPYLEFYVEADITLPDSFATIISEGYSATTKQTIQTKVKQEGVLSLFDYAVFQ